MSVTGIQEQVHFTDMNNRQKQIEQFRKFIASGAIKLGMSREEVKALLGEPDAVGGISPRYKNPTIYKYGEVEIGFGRRAHDGLLLVYLDETETAKFVMLLYDKGTSRADLRAVR